MNGQELRLVADLSAAFHFRADGPAGPVWLSPAFFELTGAARPPTPGWRWTDLIDAADSAAFLDAWRRAASEGTLLDAEVRLAVSAGTTRWYRLRAVPVRGPRKNHGAPRWVGVGLDVHDRWLLSTERNEALEYRAGASRQIEMAGRLKAEFLSTASHELRTPLNAIAGWLHVLKLRAQGDLQQLHALAALERNVLAEKKLIDSLLDVSRLTRGLETISPVAVDLVAVVRTCVSNLMPAALAKGVEVNVMAPDEPLLVNADPPKIEQVIWHLLANAIRFTELSGAVWVSVRRDGPGARLLVQDSGEGIDAAFLPYVFEPFGQRSHAASRSGLGLGLTVVRSLVELHGGSISAASDGPGWGATFEVTLPAA
jgi:signal transduction histidine kinase